MFNSLDYFEVCHEPRLQGAHHIRIACRCFASENKKKGYAETALTSYMFPRR